MEGQNTLQIVAAILTGAKLGSDVDNKMGRAPEVYAHQYYAMLAALKKKRPGTKAVMKKVGINLEAKKDEMDDDALDALLSGI